MYTPKQHAYISLSLFFFPLPKNAGKTQFTKRLILQSDRLFQTPITAYYYIYSHWQSAYSELRNHLGDKITFSDTVPTENELTTFMKPHKHGMFICDDKASEIERNAEFFQELVTRLAHHLGMTNCLIVQDASLNGKIKNSIARNCHVNCLLKSPKERSFVKSLGIALGEYKCLLSAYEQACSQPYSALIVDTHPLTPPELRYRTNIFSDNKPCIIFRPSHPGSSKHG